MHCGYRLIHYLHTRWIILISSGFVLFLVVIVVLSRRESGDWVLDHEGDLPPRIIQEVYQTGQQGTPDYVTGEGGKNESWPGGIGIGIGGGSNVANIGGGADGERHSCSIPPWRLSEFQIVFKMGATLPMDQIYPILNHTAGCFRSTNDSNTNSNVLIVSDKEEDLGQFHAHDILADLPPWYRKHNRKEFRDYDKLRANRTISQAQGHRLDKFKFLPMMEYAYQQSSAGVKWFIFVEADTFIAWDNLFSLLERYNSSLPWYFGSPAPGRDLPDGKPVWFAYGGSGYVLSRGAMEKLLAQTESLTSPDQRQQKDEGREKQQGTLLPRLSEQFQTLVKEDCCGDSVLGYVLAWKGIHLNGLYPLFNPNPLHKLPFSVENWCTPIVSMHKLHSHDISGLSRYANYSIPQRSRHGQSPPLLQADAFRYLELDRVQTLENWDNAAAAPARLLHVDADSPAHESFAACAESCHSHSGCFQFTYRENENEHSSSNLWDFVHLHQCFLTGDIKMGVRRDPRIDWYWRGRRRVSYTSGWDVDKMRGFMHEAGRCNDSRSVNWLEPGNERHY